jgi:hypothetical protein
MIHSNSGAGKLMAAVVDFPKRVVVVLAHAIKHLSAFSIADAFLETKFFSKFSTRAHMLLTNLSVLFVVLVVRGQWLI